MMAQSDTQIMEQYNETLKPVSFDKRTVRPFGLGAVWFGIVVQLTGFAVFAAMPNYFTIGQLLWIYLIGSAITAIAAIFMQDIGLKHGLCYAKSTVASFGYAGSKIPAFIRAFPSVIFFGTNAYVSSQALNELFKILFHFDNITVALAINIILLVLLTLKGLKGIERFTKFVAPLLLIVGIFLAWLLWDAYRVPLGELMSMGGTNAGSKGWLYGISVAIGIFIMCAMGNNDYTRDCVVDPKAKSLGQDEQKLFHCHIDRRCTFPDLLLPTGQLRRSSQWPYRCRGGLLRTAPGQIRGAGGDRGPVHRSGAVLHQYGGEPDAQRLCGLRFLP